MMPPPSSPDLFDPLTDAELEWLNDFLLNRFDDEVDTEGKDEGIFEISGLDGFFTAIVSGPGSIMPSQWLPALWGDFPQIWETQAAFEKVFMLLTRHLNGIVAELMDPEWTFEPLFYEREFKGRLYTVVDEWCEGFVRGMAMDAEAWRAGGPDVDRLVAPVLAFTTASDWYGHDLPLAELEALQQAIAPSIRALHTHWLRLRTPPTLTANPHPPRKSPKIGRNDPCPCGSGKKYKQCCLH